MHYEVLSVNYVGVSERSEHNQLKQALFYGYSHLASLEPSTVPEADYVYMNVIIMFTKTLWNSLYKL